MTNFNERLDEILTRFADGEYSEHWVDERKTYTKLEAKQAILDWHNKQVLNMANSPQLDNQADLVYAYRVSYIFTDKNEPERHNVKAYQDFTKKEWAEEFYQYAKGSELYEDVELEEIDYETK